MSTTKTAQPSDEVVEKLIKVQESMHGSRTSSIVLVAPTYDEVQAAIDAGPKAELTIRRVKHIDFRDVAVNEGRDSATLISRAVFDDLTLTHISDLVKTEHDEGGFSFKGQVRTYEEWKDGTWPDEPRHRGYSHDNYEIVFSPNLTVFCTWKQNGGGIGTDRDGDDD